ncbi:LOW QUALITY PROTEIN: hypothetical protein OSB04_020790 [Centaurea solstitialis]|uniref:Uncharacterized protein n=1 Tax=Centaurea solstitialis TaxID=347529 RepID=A0AA38TBD3_9ASTR|nr:LOW QUALITY PROTEIN: hypothetical protein OSB04_020790 [Centaurea solstitialis]
MLSQFSGKNKSHGGLDLPRRDRRLLVVPGEPRALLRELLEDIVDETVHDPHGLARDSDIWMNLLQHLEDILYVSTLFFVLFFFLSPAPAPPASFGSFFPAFGFFSAGAFSAAGVFFSSTGFFSAGFFSAFGAIDDDFEGRLGIGFSRLSHGLMTWRWFWSLDDGYGQGKVMDGGDLRIIAKLPREAAASSDYKVTPPLVSRPKICGLRTDSTPTELAFRPSLMESPIAIGWLRLGWVASATRRAPVGGIPDHIGHRLILDNFGPKPDC